MDAARPPRRRRRPRRRPSERVLDARLVRVASLVVAPFALLTLLTISSPGVLPPPTAGPVFDGASAAALSAQLSSTYPARIPGTPEAALAAGWYRQTMASLGVSTEEDVWREDLPGLGEVELRNVVTVIKGRSPSRIVLVAHRDNDGPGTSADNPSGTAALVELARPYGVLGAVQPPVPQRTLVLVSTDAGAWGGAGAVRFAERSQAAGDVVAVVALHGLARPGRAQIAVAAGATASPARALVSTTSARIEEQSELAPQLASPLHQLVDLAVPFALGEQGPFLERGIAAVTVSGAPAAPGQSADAGLRATSLRNLGRAVEALVGSLDASPRRSFGTPDAVFLEQRVVSGWALRLLLVVCVVPFAVGVVDLVARSRRRRLPLRPAVRALRRRVAFWLFAGVLLWVASLLGVVPTGAALPFPPTGPAAEAWSVTGVVALGAVLALAWLVERVPLTPRARASDDERLAGHVVALAWLGIVAVVVAVVQPYALAFLLPSLYAWLWLPQQPSTASRAVLYPLGLSGPVLGLVVLARSLDITVVQAARYVVELAGVGYIAPSSVLLALAWAASAAQLGALAFGRYAPYAGGQEPPPPGLLRTSIGPAGRRLVASRQGSGT